jgi:hypothetical protein
MWYTIGHKPSQGSPMPLMIRKLVTYVEDVLIEGGRAAEPVRMAGVAAVIRNPWAAQGFVENLRPEILSVAPALAHRIVPALIELCGGAESIEAYGKAAVVGTSGEIEHASALIHTLRFGNILRDAAQGTEFLPFTNIRAGAGAPIMVPIKHKLDGGRRSHFMTLHFTVPDAPFADEIVVAIAAATGARLHPRIGDRYEDLKELAQEIELSTRDQPTATHTTRNQA